MYYPESDAKDSQHLQQKKQWAATMLVQLLQEQASLLLPSARLACISTGCTSFPKSSKSLSFALGIR